MVVNTLFLQLGTTDITGIVSIECINETGSGRFQIFWIEV